MSHRDEASANPRLKGVLAKLDRADRIAKDVRSLAESLREPDPYHFTEEVDLEANHCVLRRKLVRELPVDELGVLIGDCLHNLRSALDHIVWQLVEANGNWPHGSLQFPVTQDLKSFTEEAKNRLRGTSERAKKLIEAMQPYHRWNDPALSHIVGPHPLGTVHELNRTDKHRIIVPTLWVTSASLFGIGGTDIRPTRQWLAPYGPPHDDQIVGVFSFVRTGPNPEVHLNASAAYEIVIETNGQGHSPSIILEEARAYIAGPVIRRLAPLLN